ncbi:tripartite tricarboxylate transporter substrate binding protein [Variovorax sp. OV329]|uniref:Bug family tripartite tricarboxylate transporter substrate binding protein n=1 Tax=Variovorax sp. OV329 TaxID=1882825 RepID=UPI0008F27A71|nr:tripartite tricarboxylate transporter substrate binding protein [Variovorax sp. OV329]SFM92370.1 Tripartite-type tricarboxylate transporter, receptor component TctC [Variovorax sp. OV329]
MNAVKLSAACLFLLAVVSAGPGSAQAQSQQVVRIVVPYAAGAPTDIAARQLAEALRKVTGMNYIVDPKPGAAGTIGSGDVAKSRPDGYTLLYTTGGHTSNATFYSKLPYDTAKDFTAISMISKSAGFALIVPKTSRYASLEELIAAAKATPEKLSYGSSGVGNTTHIVAATFERAAGVKLLHVPYKASPLNDLRAGMIDMTFIGSAAASLLVRDGEARALAVTGSERDPFLPGVPSTAERGIKGVDVPAWAGVFAPGGMAPELARKINGEIAQAKKDRTYVEASRLANRAIVDMPQPEFAAFVQDELDRYRRDLPALGITSE